MPNEKGRAAQEPRRSRVLPAKLLAPRLPAIHPRPRLLRLIDRLRDRPLIWIEGPAGSGKTTLAADYVRARKLNALWYRFDDRDADPAALFYHLRQAVARISPRRRETVPLLTPAYLQGFPVFTRNFFEAVYARLKRPAALVLDNVHDLPVQSVLRRLLPEALAGAPDGVIVLALSRTAPPPEFAALQVGSRLSTVGGQDLNFSFAEAKRLARVRGATGLSRTAVDAICESTGGWAAGLVLTLEHARATNIAEDEGRRVTREALFHYFATELLERAAPAERDLLLKTSVLPQVRPLHANALVGIDNAADVLADLVRRNFFTVRSGEAEPVYQYHMLFREFLRARLRETETVDGLREIYRLAAALLAEEDPAEAGALLISAQDHAGLAALVLRHAVPLVRSGRYATLAGWLAHVPRALIDSEPWLACWLAVTEFPRDPAGALGRILRAMEIFRTRGDLAGLGLAFSMHADLSFADFGNFRGFDRTLAGLVDSITPETTFPSHEIELRVAGGMLVMLLWSRPWREELEPWARRATALVAGAADAHLQLQVTHHLAVYHYWRGEPRRTEEILAAVTRGRDWDSTDPLLAAVWLLLDAVQGWYTADRVRWRSAAERSIAIAEKHGIGAFLPLPLSQAVYGALSEGDLSVAGHYLKRIEGSLIPGVNLGVGHFRFLSGWAKLIVGDLRAAIEFLGSATEILGQIGLPFLEALSRALLAQALYETGCPKEGERNLAAVEDVAARMESALLRSLALVARVDEASRRGDDAATQSHLRELLLGARAAGMVNFPGWRSDLMARLLAAALRFGVETDYATSLIRRRRLLPPPGAEDLEGWPWPIRIQMLGRFLVQRDGAEIGLGASGGARPIELLKALVALGGREVDEASLAEQLWPEAEGDRAHRSLKVNVHRLRRLLGEDCVTWVHRRLSLDARRVWIDAWALERALGALESALTAHRDERIAALAGVALALNRGDFLHGDSSRWTLAARERLRARFQRVLGDAAEALSACGHTAEAARCYEKALEVDPIVERFYQGLMRCHLDLGQRANGLAVYQRCSDTLWRELRVAPSAKTETLRTALLSR